MITNDLRSIIKGVDVVTITPFTVDLKVDEPGIRKNIRYLIESGIVKGSGILTPLGSTGECFSLSIEERKRVAEIVLEEAYGKVPVFVGCNDNNVDTVIELANHAESIKATGIQLIPPYYAGPHSKAQIIAFYKKIANETILPIILYNNPYVSKVDLNVDTLSELSKIDNVVALKECSPVLVKIEEVIRKLSDKIAIITGSSAPEPYTSLMGSVGFVSGISNALPKYELGLYELIAEGNYVKAKEYHNKIYPWYEFGRRINEIGGGGQNIPVMKEAVNMVGLAGGYIKLPLLPLNIEEKKELRRILLNLGAEIVI